MIFSYVGKKVKVKNGVNKGIEGIIILHEKDEVDRDVVRLKITKGRTSLTDYFLTDLDLI